jgi:hypothetical protein
MRQEIYVAVWGRFVDVVITCTVMFTSLLIANKILLLFQRPEQEPDHKDSSRRISWTEVSYFTVSNVYPNTHRR